MASRVLHDSVWGDAWFQDLPPASKLVWVYLLTNPHLEVSGIYQITPKTISNETGIPFIDVNGIDVNGILEGFVADKKIVYDGYFVGIVNYHRHNGMMNNPKYRAAIRKSLAKLDERRRTLFCARLGIDTQSIPNALPIDTQSIPNPQSAPNIIEYNRIESNEIECNRIKDMPPTPSRPRETKTEFLSSAWILAIIENMEFDAKVNLKCNLTEKQVITLIDTYTWNTVRAMVEIYYAWKGTSGKSTKSDYLSLRKEWVIERARLEMSKQPTTQPTTKNPPPANAPANWDTMTQEERRQWRITTTKAATK